MAQNEKEKIIVLGAGLFAEDVAEYLGKRYELVGFVEGIHREKCREKVLGLPVIWVDDLGTFSRSCKAVCAVGSVKRKNFIEQALKAGIEFVSLVHPGAWVSSTVKLGKGAIVGPGTVIAAGAKIGSHVIINRGCLIGHHVEVGDYVTISPGANIGGKSKIGDLCYVGMGAIILDGISIGSRAVIGSGSVVTKEVPDSVQVLGIPAKIAKEIKE